MLDRIDRSKLYLRERVSHTWLLDSCARAL
jgi:hypothetical protein